MKSIDIKIERNKLPPPSSVDYMVILDQIEGDTRKDENRLNDKSKRTFEVKALLSKALFFNQRVDFSIDEKAGSSFFVIPPNAVKMLIPNTFGVFTCYKNEANELSLITTNIEANGWEEAFQIFFKVVSPFLDHLSFLTNSPFIISKVFCRDKKNDYSVHSYEVPYYSVSINPDVKSIPNELIPIFSLYREAKNNVSSYYRFLCYYKILEGIFKYIRPQLFLLSKEKNITIQPVKEKVPDHKDLGHEHKIFVGENIRKIFDDYLTNQFRNTVAHYLLDDGSVLNVSDYYINTKFNKVLLLIELCVREVIVNQLNYFEQFYEGSN
ncbi:hypothetical protein BMS3Abin03_02070 [bacterium BMS3Abin03]|nr:hypothetical protein BMS3Abin03_02070 [bacterium BMS3Abin03]